MWRFISVLLGLASVAGAEPTHYPAPGNGRDVLSIYSTLDQPLATPLIMAFQARNPGVTVIYDDLLAADIATRVIGETDAGTATADFVFSSGMDLQVKLTNDGYAQPVSVPLARDWPDWANWRDMAFALTFEPGVLVWHKPSFPDGPPESRLEVIDWLSRPQAMGRIGTYDVTRSAVGYLYLARDAEHFADIWSLVAAMGRAGLQTFATSQDIIDRVADGRLALGYNILGSYADARARSEPNLGLLLLKDFTVVVSRVGLVPRAAARPDLGTDFLAFLMGREGQTIMADQLRLAAISLEVSGDNSARAMEAALGEQLRPVPVSPGLLAYLDQSKRARLIARWTAALQGAAPP
ncbi:ABC transporter substrate-binding protein [Tabrizicola sp.]|uniref:ABC transporter substrate-binding protein n=1 Tax=Tabrizicola sp. TaxID=2005166 RepID=UPI002623449C|nr:ABC transporter substrate-binding protein [Tabrizicola sp.]MDM7931930.1 ABC transporter substrate-binding protein [Tabrizicola sp.]